MARRRNPPESVRAKWQLADRLRTIRTELFGERGLAELARRLVVPIRTWYSYETGVTVPAEILLQFVELTRVEPLWLLHGRGPKYQAIDLQEMDVPTAMPPVWLYNNSLPSGVEEVSYPAAGHSSLSYGHSLDGEGEFAASSSAIAILEADPADPELRPTIDFQPQTAPLTPLRTGGPSCRCLRIEGDAMWPILTDGAFVAFSECAEDLCELEGKLVIAHLDTRPIVRWFHRSGHYGVLRAENPTYEPATQLIDLAGVPQQRDIRRVLWIGTGH
ncbi:MAG TPA: S24 family peptidase [Isosphaeraceae bacterium]|jgi:hypothetical protein|nr:S24 family peptidase [Isosphaeraceae bacterium]